MARISLKCKCGWSFFIAGSTQGHQVTCSSCGALVAIPGRVPGQAVLTPGELAARKIQQAKMKKMIAGIVGGVIVILVLLVWQLSGSDESTSPKDSTKYSQRRKPDSALPPQQAPTGPDNSPHRVLKPGEEEKLASPKIDLPSLRNRIYERVWYVNMRGIVAEALRLKGQEAARDTVLRDMGQDESNLQSMIKQLADAGGQIDIQDRMMQGDQIVALDGGPVAGVPVENGRGVLENWLRKFRPSAQSTEIVVMRGSQKKALYIGFTKETKELLKLARYPDTLETKYVPLAKPPPPIPLPLPVALDPAVLEDVAARFKALPPGYRLFLSPTDRSRLDRLQKGRRGNRVDVQFLTTLQNDVLLKYEADARRIKSKLEELRPKALKGTMASDVIHFKDGRKIQCEVVEKADTYVWVKLRFGRVKYLMKDILRIVRGGGAGGEFPGRHDKAKGDVKALEALLAWCKEKSLKLQGEFVGLLILEKEPTHDDARKAAGIPRPAGVPRLGRLAPPPGRPARPPGGVPSGATIPYEGKNWLPIDLKRHLLRNKKYALIEGRWYRGREKQFIVKGLFKKQSTRSATILGISVPLIEVLEGIRKPGRGGTHILVPAPASISPKERFYAPSFVVKTAGVPSRQNGDTPTASPPGAELTGEVHISVGLDGPLLEASVRMRAEVKGGGFITVYVRGRQQRFRLFDITRDEFKSRPIPPEHILGLRRLDLAAVIKMRAKYTEKTRIEKITLIKHTEVMPDYAVKLFPSTVHTLEVFRLRAVVGEPVNSLDKLFEPFPQVLR